MQHTVIHANTRPVKRLPTRRHFVLHLCRNTAIVLGFVAISLALGMTGYHWIMGLSWLDSALNAAMILTGMGPLSQAKYDTVGAKVFGIFYTLFSGVAFLTITAVLLGPVAARFLHRLHLEIYGEEGNPAAQS